ncbi:MAG TPA: glycosyltransferase family 39 protein [Myxococcota bacterium]|nr:glycosyltransferase family 39 protein [Myxococcota bacterium]
MTTSSATIANTISLMATRLAAIVAFLLLFYQAGSGSLLPSDDSAYARAAIEGTRGGRLADVTWMGHPLFEKGPVLFSAIQIGGLAGGSVELQARLPGIVFGLMVLLLIFRIGLDLGLSRQASILAAGLCLATSVFFFNARRPMTDIPGLMFALAGFRAMTIARWRSQAFLGGVMFGLSSLCKLTSPVPFIIAAVAARIAGYRPRADSEPADTLSPAAWSVLGLAGGLAAFLPWHAWMAVEHGSRFIETYFGYHLFGRMSAAVVGTGRAEAYLGWLASRDVVGAALLAITFPVAMILAIRRNRPAFVVLLLVLLPLAPLLVSSTALPHYLVPCVAGTSLAAGLAADKLLKRIGGSRSRLVATIAMAAICAASFLNSNLKDMLDPDYSPASKTLCQEMLADRSAARIAGMFDLHDMAVPLYCDMNMDLFVSNPGFRAAVKDIPMLKPIVRDLDARTIRGLADTGEILVCEHHGLPVLKSMAAASGLDVRVKSVKGLFAVSFFRPGQDGS